MITRDEKDDADLEILPPRKYKVRKAIERLSRVDYTNMIEKNSCRAR